MDNVLDSHFINQLERKFEKSKFARVDSDIIDKLIQKDEEIPSKLSEDQKNTLKPIIENQVDKTKFSVQFESLSESEQPILITQNEFMRRMRDMSAVGGGANYFGQLPEQYNLIVNSNHSLIIRLLEEKEVEKQNKYAKQLTDLALLSQNLLKGEELTKFIKRSTELI